MELRRRPFGFLLVPALGGLLLILVGVLIFLHPNLVAYAVAACFVALGLALLALAWRSKGVSVYYRQVEQRWEPRD